MIIPLQFVMTGLFGKSKRLLILSVYLSYQHLRFCSTASGKNYSPPEIPLSASKKPNPLAGSGRLAAKAYTMARHQPPQGQPA